MNDPPVVTVNQHTYRHEYQTFDDGTFEVGLQPLVISELQAEVRYLSDKLDTIRRQAAARGARYRARRMTYYREASKTWNLQPGSDAKMHHEEPLVAARRHECPSCGAWHRVQPASVCGYCGRARGHLSSCALLQPGGEAPHGE